MFTAENKRRILVGFESHVYELSEDGEFVCTHNDATIEPPCCDGSPDEAGRYTCGCMGQESIVCNNPECTGIEDWQVDDLFERERQQIQ